MKMGNLEKVFVNSASHSQNVSHHAERLLGYIQFEPGQHYLDVGCGNGAAPIHIAKKFHLCVTGVDVDPEQIETALASSQGMSQVCFRTLDGTQLPFEDEAFDIVFTNKVTHHIPNWPDALAEMLRVLKGGGYFIYSDLVFPALLATLGESMAGNWFGFPTRQALDTFMLKNGLAAIHLSARTVHYEGVFQK